MLKTRVIPAIAVLLGVAVIAEASPSERPSTPKQAIKQQYDYNGNGKLGRMEKAAARPAQAQLRQQRALRRNARAIRGIYFY